MGGVFLFDVPNSDPGSPDCSLWEVSAAAVLQDYDTINLSFAGIFCGSGGGKLGIFRANLSGVKAMPWIPLLLFDQ
jgi:hypothetical protein